MNSWLLQHFFNPGFVLPWGAALVAAPIIIHLINRMRYRRVRFAAMEFLLQSQQRNRRRILFEQLLLLLLRILIVLGMLALIARLILDPGQLALFRGTKAHHLVLLDDSGSMHDRWGESSAFQNALEVAKRIAAEGTRRPNSQTYSLLLLSNPEEPEFLQRDVDESFVGELETRLGNLKCSHQSLDLADGLEAARSFFAQEKATVQYLHVVSDFRNRDWTESRAVGESIELLDDDGVTINLVRTVDAPHENLAVTELSGDLQVAAVGVPVRLKTVLENFGKQAARDVRLSVVADGAKLPMSITFEKVEPSTAVAREFDVTFDSPGKHQLRVGLEEDALSEDNARYLAIDISQSNDVLIIDGNPVADAGSFVTDALAADASLTGFAPLVESVDYLRKHPLSSFQCIYLLNVAELPSDALKPLTEYVAGGGGLAWFLGDAVQPSFYNDALYAEGNGIFPVPLGPARQELPSDAATNPGPDLVFADHPIFRVFQGQDNPFVESVRIGSYLPAAEGWIRDDNERKDGVTTVAVLRNKQPFMFEHRFGRGRIITCLSTAGPQWNNWARNPSYVIFQLELEKHIARNDRVQQTRLVGEPIDFSLDAAEYSDAIEIAAPDTGGERTTRLRAAPAEAATRDEDSSSELRLSAAYTETDVPGVYRVRLIDRNQVPEESWIAYNVPVSESDLDVATDEQVRQQIGGDVRVEIQAPGDYRWIEGKDAGQDVRRVLLVVLVCLLLAEQALAYRLSYHPRTAGVSA